MSDAPAGSKSNVLVVLRYLGLPQDYQPSPLTEPVDFLSKHMPSLPQNLLSLFSSQVTAKQRTVLPAIRNRRLRYFESSPPEFAMPAATALFAYLWPGTLGNNVAREEAEDEKQWADKEFLGGHGKQVGKLGALLGGYEEEREAERTRALRRQQREAEESFPEEDEDTDDEEAAAEAAKEELTPQEAEQLFKRRLKERFIYGLLEVRICSLLFVVACLYNQPLGC